VLMGLLSLCESPLLVVPIFLFLQGIRLASRKLILEPGRAAAALPRQEITEPVRRTIKRWNRISAAITLPLVAVTGAAVFALLYALAALRRQAAGGADALFIEGHPVVLAVVGGLMGLFLVGLSGYGLYRLILRERLILYLRCEMQRTHNEGLLPLYHKLVVGISFVMLPVGLLLANSYVAFRADCIALNEPWMAGEQRVGYDKVEAVYFASEFRIRKTKSDDWVPGPDLAVDLTGGRRIEPAGLLRLPDAETDLRIARRAARLGGVPLQRVRRIHRRGRHPPAEGQPSRPGDDG